MQTAAAKLRNGWLVTGVAVAAVLFAAACASTASRAPAGQGFSDAHTHLSYFGPAALDSLLAHGVTLVRDCGGDPVMLRAMRDSIAAGSRRGPRIYFSGPVLDGPKDARYRITVATEEDARRAVDSLVSLGVDFVKTHNAVPRAAYFAVLREARRRGLKVASHIPRGVPAWEAADSGARSIEHAAESMVISPIYAGYATDAESAVAWWRSPAGDSAIARLARSGAAFTPTLAHYRANALAQADPRVRSARLELLEFLKELTGRMHRAGVPILVGSDFANPGADPAPGRSVHEEVQLLVESGLSQAAARAAATTGLLRWLEAPPR